MLHYLTFSTLTNIPCAAHLNNTRKRVLNYEKIDRKILLKARQMVKFRHLNSAWSSDGNILVRDSSDTKHRITSKADLAVFGPVPQLPAAGGTDSQTTALHTPQY